jgi:hypothetical protein
MVFGSAVADAGNAIAELRDQEDNTGRYIAFTPPITFAFVKGHDCGLRHQEHDDEKHCLPLWSPVSQDSPCNCLCPRNLTNLRIWTSV